MKFEFKKVLELVYKFKEWTVTTYSPTQSSEQEKQSLHLWSQHIQASKSLGELYFFCCCCSM